MIRKILNLKLFILYSLMIIMGFSIGFGYTVVNTKHNNIDTVKKTTQVNLQNSVVEQTVDEANQDNNTNEDNYTDEQTLDEPNADNNTSEDNNSNQDSNTSVDDATVVQDNDID
jgi:cytoskeletal protein RodZ